MGGDCKGGLYCVYKLCRFFISHCVSSAYGNKSHVAFYVFIVGRYISIPCDIVADIVEGYDIAVMPCHVLKEKSDVFLDGMTVKELSKKTGKKIRITNGTGESFVKALSSRKFKEV